MKNRKRTAWDHYWDRPHPILITIVAIAMMAGVGAMFHSYEQTPVVYKSHSTGSIIKVEKNHQPISGPLPRKYEVVWVE